MNKKIIIIGLICLILIGGSVFLLNLFKNEVVYSNTFYFDMGSHKIKIYSNGDVYDDLEIENQNHKPNYKKIKTLTNDEMMELKSKIKNNSDSNLDDYIKKIIYGGTNINPYKTN